MLCGAVDWMRLRKKQQKGQAGRVSWLTRHILPGSRVQGALLGDFDAKLVLRSRDHANRFERTTAPSAE